MRFLNVMLHKPGSICKCKDCASEHLTDVSGRLAAQQMLYHREQAWPLQPLSYIHLTSTWTAESDQSCLPIQTVKHIHNWTFRGKNEVPLAKINHFIFIKVTFQRQREREGGWVWVVYICEWCSHTITKYRHPVSMVAGFVLEAAGADLIMMRDKWWR